MKHRTLFYYHFFTMGVFDVAVTSLIISSLLIKVSSLTFISNRREAIQIAAGTTISVLTSNVNQASSSEVPERRKSLELLAYEIIPDASAKKNPKLKSVKKSDLIKSISMKSGSIWLGEHHNAERDHILQAEMIRKISSKRKQGKPLAVGLEQVQIQFQSVLDDYISNKISIDQMRKGVEWDKRWQWPFDAYREVFEVAQELRIPLIALNVNSEDLAQVESGGLPNLSREKLKQYIPDGAGFAKFSKAEGYKMYVEYCILPSYDLHKEMGLLQYTITGQKLEQDMPFKNFFSSRILWDEFMASAAFEWTQKNPNGLIVGLVGSDHVKFRNGIVGRYARLAEGTKKQTISIMINPSLIDTSLPGSIRISDNTRLVDSLTLQLTYFKKGVDATTSARFLPENSAGILPLSDYIITNA